MSAVPVKFSQCPCGVSFLAYLPEGRLSTEKQRLFGLLGPTGGDAAKGVEVAKALCESAGAVFVDLRETDTATCPGCGAEVAFGIAAKQRLSGLSDDALFDRLAELLN